MKNDNNYILPPTDLLKRSDVAVIPQTSDEIDKNARSLLRALESLGVFASIENITRGPAFTVYEISLPKGTKMNNICSISDDLSARLLCVGDIRMSVHLPYRNTVDIEVPYKVSDRISLKDIIESKEFTNKDTLPFAVGRKTDGEIITGDIVKLPHLLIAGDSHSGKSCFLDSIIMSILFSRKPQDVNLVLIDTRSDHLSLYKDIPHLAMPVITDPKEGTEALSWTVDEMYIRYKNFSDIRVRNIDEYNKLSENPLQRIVIVIDEAEDLIMRTEKYMAVECMVRIAQMGRAAGIHLIMTAQCMTDAEMSGLIKAYIPSRAAFRVSDGEKSKAIIGKKGAEKLVGNGDMLYAPTGYMGPVRMQAAYVSSEDIVNVTKYIRSYCT